MKNDAADLSARPQKRSFTIRGHRTSISLEAAFWDALRDQAAREKLSLAGLVAQVDAERGATNLSSAVRVWILKRYRNADRNSASTEPREDRK